MINQSPSAPDRAVRILIADDHAVLRAGLRMLLSAEPDMIVVSEAAGGREAVTMAQMFTPDVVVMDVSMTEGTGIEATEQIRRELPDVRVVALSRHADPAYARRMLEAGATGYVVKKTSATALIDAIRTVAQGGTYLDAATTSSAVTGALSQGSGHRVRIAELTKREAEVLREVARGRSNREIAQQLGLSIKTIESHKARSCSKLNLRSRADIVKYAIRERWLE